MIFLFLKNLIYGHVFIQAAVIVLWLEFFLSSSEEETDLQLIYSNELRSILLFGGGC